jgi:hypothetical protein
MVPVVTVMVRASNYQSYNQMGTLGYNQTKAAQEIQAYRVTARALQLAVHN